MFARQPCCSLDKAFSKGTRRCGKNASRHPFGSLGQAFLKACGFQRQSLGRASQRAKFSLRRFSFSNFSLCASFLQREKWSSGSRFVAGSRKAFKKVLSKRTNWVCANIACCGTLSFLKNIGAAASAATAPIKGPAEPCNREVETLASRAVSSLRLYCSQRPYAVETSQSIHAYGRSANHREVRLL